MDPYLKIRSAPRGERTTPRANLTTPGFLPYLPLMAVAGHPSEIWPNNGLE